MKNKIDIKNNLINGLYIIATPIGNLDDISIRATNILKKVSIIICENPKHSLRLLNKLGIKKRLLSLHDYNETNIIKRISKEAENTSIALISDAGSPLISDPGYKLVKYFLEKKINTTAIPGASAVISSLQLSGLAINNFAFFGFVPKKHSQKKEFFKKIIDISITSVFFISGKNLLKTIKDLIEFMGDREIAICKEITKINERVIREKASKCLTLLEKNILLLKGEFTIVVGHKINESPKPLNKNIKSELSNLLKKYSLTEAVKIVHNLSNISRKEIYKMAIEIKDE